MIAQPKRHEQVCVGSCNCSTLNLGRATAFNADILCENADTERQVVSHSGDLFGLPIFTAFFKKVAIQSKRVDEPI